MVQLRASQSQKQSEAARETARFPVGIRNHRVNLRDQKLYNFRRTRRNLSSTNVNRIGFQYDCNTDYCLHIGVRIGPMDAVCEYCGALKFSGETPGLCYLIGKVELSLLTPPLEL